MQGWQVSSRCSLGCLFARFLESNWFVWVTQMNHIPMHIDHDRNMDWVSTQVKLVCMPNAHHREGRVLWPAWSPFCLHSWRPPAMWSSPSSTTGSVATSTSRSSTSEWG